LGPIMDLLHNISSWVIIDVNAYIRYVEY